MAKTKIRISKPFYKNDEWVVQVQEGLSPIAPVKAEYTFPNRELADKCYRHLLIEHGKWI